MTRRIFRSILGACILVLLLSVLGTVFTMYRSFLAEETQQLQQQARIAADLANQKGNQILKNIPGLEMRISLMDPQGIVVYDSLDKGVGVDHSDRKEIVEASQKGTGSSLRFSDSLSDETYYAAVRLDDGSYIRLSRSHSSLLALLFEAMIPVFLFALAAIVLSWFIARILSDAITRPINAIDPEHPLDSCPYEQLLPLQEKLEENRLQIESQMKQLDQKAREFEVLSDHMDEGLIMTNARGELLTSNKAFRKIFKAKEGWTVESEPVLASLQSEAAKNKKASASLRLNGRIYALEAARIDGTGTDGYLFLVQDVTEKKEAEERRQQFTANVTHELKTPLQTISSSAELLQAGIVRQEDTPRFAGYIVQEAKRMSAMIHDIIHLSRLESENVPEENLPVMDLASIAASQADKLSSALNMHSITLTTHLEYAPVKARQKDLEAILSNLLENAIHYNAENGSILLDVHSDQKKVICSISDTGMGIDPALQDRIFERFFTADPSRSKTGTGLGLSIVAHTVKKLNGKIKLRSKPGQGSTFTIRLPKAQ